MTRYKHLLTSFAVAALFAACGGSASDAGPAPESSSAPAAACTAPAYPSSGYSQVFKDCDPSGTPRYHERSECFRDNASVLIWMGQTPDGDGPRARDRRFTHFDNTAQEQKYFGDMAGAPVFIQPTQTEIDAPGNSIGFKTEINASRLCGSGDWRLPTKAEFLTQAASADWRAWYLNASTSYYLFADPAAPSWAAGSGRIEDSGVTAAAQYRNGPFALRLVR